MDKLYGSPTFYALLSEMRETHNAKSHDYAKDSDPYGNYKFAGLVSSLFAHSPDDAGFAGRLAEKMFRLAVLGQRREEPKNESVDDTERDIAVIAALWMAARRDKRAGIPAQSAEDVREQACYSPERGEATAKSPLTPFGMISYLQEVIDSLSSNVGGPASVLSHPQSKKSYEDQNP